MLIGDIVKLSFNSLNDQRMRSFLTILGIAVGIASVVLLTSIGEGVQQFTIAEFTQFGTNLIGINPGKSTTLGTSGALINNVRPLSIADEESLKHIPGVIEGQEKALLLFGTLSVFFNDTATAEIYTLSLHDALPISGNCLQRFDGLE